MVQNVIFWGDKINTRFEIKISNKTRHILAKDCRRLASISIINIIGNSHENSAPIFSTTYRRENGFGDNENRRKGSMFNWDNDLQNIKNVISYVLI